MNDFLEIVVHAQISYLWIRVKHLVSLFQEKLSELRNLITFVSVSTPFHSVHIENRWKTSAYSSFIEIKFLAGVLSITLLSLQVKKEVKKNENLSLPFCI